MTVAPAPPDWSFVADNAGTHQAMARAADRRLTVRLSAPSEASFTLAGTDEQAGAVTELVTDVLVLRDGVKLYRGRVGATSDALDASTHRVEVPTGDYRALLQRRNLYDDDQVVWSDDQSDIAWGLVQQTQARTGGALGITRGVGVVTGVVRDRTYEAGKPIGEAIQQLSEAPDGFDWDINADKELDIFYPTRDNGHAVVLDYGGAIKAVKRNVDPSAYANALRMNGADTLLPEVREAVDLASRPEGRWDGQYGVTTITEQGTLADRADWQLAVAQQVVPAYSVTFKGGRWGGRDHVWVGDTCRLVVQHGRLAVNTLLRVVELAITVPANGWEEVTATLGIPLATVGSMVAGQAARLDQLERR